MDERQRGNMENLMVMMEEDGVDEEARTFFVRAEARFNELEDNIAALRHQLTAEIALRIDYEAPYKKED